MRVQLTLPVKNEAGQEISALDMREDIRLGDMLASARASETDAWLGDVTLVARLCGSSVMVMEQLAYSDWLRLHSKVLSLKNLSTGADSKAIAPETQSASARDTGPQAS